MATLTLCVRFRWWVRPYIWVCIAFLRSVVWALDDDDERFDAFIERQAQFIVQNGLRFD